MDVPVIDWLNGVSGTVFRVAALLFVLVNAGAVALVIVRRDRALVQRWTSPWLAANLLLLGAGIGVPTLAALAKLAVYAFAGVGLMGTTWRGIVPGPVTRDRDSRPATPRRGRAGVNSYP
jgi:hypothetical protein